MSDQRDLRPPQDRPRGGIQSVLTSVLCIRMSADEASLIAAAARRNGLTLSGFGRKILVGGIGLDPEATPGGTGTTQ